MVDLSPKTSDAWLPGYYDVNNFRELGEQTMNLPTWKKTVAKAMAQNVASGTGAGYPAGWDFETLGNWEKDIGAGEYASAGLITQISTYLDSYVPGTSPYIDSFGTKPAPSPNDRIEGPEAFAFRIQQEGLAEDRQLTREQQEFQQAKFFIELAAGSSAASLRSSGGGSVPGVVRQSSGGGGGGGGGGGSDTTYRYSESVSRSFTDPAELALRKAISDAELALAQGRLNLDQINSEVDRAYRTALTADIARQSAQRDEELKLRRAETFSKIAANPNDAVQREYFLRMGQSPTGTPTDVFTGQVSGAPTTLPQLMEQQAPLLQPYTQGGMTGAPPAPPPVPQLPPVPTAAEGTYGYVNDQQMVVGDSLDGRPNEELIENPTGAPIKIVPLSAMARGTEYPRRYATGSYSNLPGYTNVGAIRQQREAGITPAIESGMENSAAYQGWLDSGSPELSSAEDYRNAGFQYSSGGFIDPATGFDANQRRALSDLAARNAAKEELPFYYGDDSRMDAGTAYEDYRMIHAGQQIFNGKLVDLWTDPQSGMLYRFDDAGNKFSVTDTTALGAYNPVFSETGKITGVSNWVNNDYTNVGPVGFPTGQLQGSVNNPSGPGFTQINEDGSISNIESDVEDSGVGLNIGEPIKGFRPVFSGGAYTSPDGGGKITLQTGDYLGPDGTVYRWNSVLGKHDVVPYVPTAITTEAQFYALPEEARTAILRGRPTGYITGMDMSGLLNGGTMGGSTDLPVSYEQFRGLPQQTLRDLAEGVFTEETFPNSYGMNPAYMPNDAYKLGVRPRSYAASSTSTNYTVPTPSGQRPTGLMVGPKLGDEQYDYVDYNPYFEQFSEQDWNNLYPQMVDTNPASEQDVRQQVMENIGLGDFDTTNAAQSNPPGASIPITMPNQPEHFRMIVDPYTGNVYVSQDWGVTWFNKGKPEVPHGQLAGSGSLWDTVNRIITQASGGQWGLINTPQGYALGTRTLSSGLTSPTSTTTTTTAPTGPLTQAQWEASGAGHGISGYNRYLAGYTAPTSPAPAPTAPTTPSPYGPGLGGYNPTPTTPLPTGPTTPTAPVPYLPPVPSTLPPPPVATLPGSTPTTPTTPTPTTPQAPANPVFQPSTAPATSSPSLSAIQYPNDVYQNLPVLQVASGQIPLSAYAQLGSTPTNIPALGNTVLPSPAQGNYTTLNYLYENSPASYALLSSLYAAGNRDLDSELASVKANAPRGQAYIPSLIQT